MRVLIAPDDFKGTFTAPEVTAAIARGCRAAGGEADELPIADGGNGTMNAIVASLGGEIHPACVSDPLGRPVEARWALLPDGRQPSTPPRRAGCGASRPKSETPGRRARAGPAS